MFEKPVVKFSPEVRLWIVYPGYDLKPTHGYRRWEDAFASALSMVDTLSVFRPRPPRVIGWPDRETA